MMWVNVLRYCSMRGIHAAVLGAVLLGSATVAFAQSPAAASSPAGKHYAKSRSFDLPVKMDQDFRTQLKEIRLYVKTPTGQWALQETGSPSCEKFSCKVPQDGEYWYMLVTVERSGHMSPADLNAEPPSQQVVVDTVAPQIQVQAVPTSNGDLLLRLARLWMRIPTGPRCVLCAEPTLAKSHWRWSPANWAFSASRRRAFKADGNRHGQGPCQE